MMALFALIFPMLTFAGPPLHWSGLTEVSERHEFYQNNEAILKPKDSWQVLFAVGYPDRELRMLKDCVYYRVPGEEAGTFKIKKVAKNEQCETYIDVSGDLEVKDLKAMQFSLGTNELSVHFTFTNFQDEKWQFPLLNFHERPVPKLFTSSASYKAPAMIMLGPETDGIKDNVKPSMESGTICHDISEECVELSASTCNQCSMGWYEAPNGCVQGPKFCGIHECGKKDRPACRRGMKYQRQRKKFDCRVDPSFAYCSPGLSLQCEGALAYCR